MKRGLHWQGASSGPDLMDVTSAIVAIENMHGVSVSLVLSRAGVYGEGGLDLVVMAERKVIPPGGVRRSVSRRFRVPSVGHATLEGALYRAVIEIDRDCSTFWEQETLPA